MAERVVWLGAGFSYHVTKGDLPLMQGFFDRLDHARFPWLAAFLDDLGEHRAAANVENVICMLEEQEDCPFGRTIKTQIGASHDFKSIREDLHGYCLQRLCCASLSDYSWAADLLANNCTHATVVTTNYDNVAERILSGLPGLVHGLRGTSDCPHCIMRSVLEHECGCHGVGRPEPSWHHGLLKLHGSVAWHVCRNPKCSALECLVADAHCRPFTRRNCKCCGSLCEPVLVMPTKQKRYRQFPKLNRMWDAAFSALQQAEELLLFGFSFAESDSVICQMFSNALASNTRDLQVWVADVRPEAVEQRFRRAVRASRHMTIEPLVVPADFSEPDWWASAAAAAQ